MPIKFAVAPRTILLCDYDLGGFRPPEMVKCRPAIVLSGRLPRRDNLMTVVPLSGTESNETYHCRIELSQPLPEPFAETIWWVKADMVATVCFKRLDFFRTDRDHNGNRRYLNSIKVSEENFSVIKETVKRAIGVA